SNNIGLVLAQAHEQVFIDEYIPNIVTGLSRMTQALGFRILVELAEDGSSPNTYLDLLRGKEVAGIILQFNSPGEEDIQALVGAVGVGYPIVSLNHYHDAVPSVRVDKLAGVRSILNHLINLGHRRIACITFAPVPDSAEAHRRLTVYRETLESAGIPC